MKTLHKELHKELHNADICVPEKPQDVFSRREIESYNDLGLILKRIHVRLRDEVGVENLDILINKSVLNTNYDNTAAN